MALSHIAAVITYLETLTGVGGVSVAPLPADAPFPYLVVREIGNTELQNLQGRSNVSRSVIQIECWDKVYETAWNMREQVKNNTIDLNTVIGGLSLIGPISHIGDYELYDPIRELHQLMVRLSVWWG